jgi:hypothetical protein
MALRRTGYSKDARTNAALARSIKSLLGEQAWHSFQKTGNYDKGALDAARRKKLGKGSRGSTRAQKGLSGAEKIKAVATNPTTLQAAQLMVQAIQAGNHDDVGQMSEFAARNLSDDDFTALVSALHTSDALGHPNGPLSEPSFADRLDALGLADATNITQGDSGWSSEHLTPQQKSNLDWLDKHNVSETPLQQTMDESGLSEEQLVQMRDAWLSENPDEVQSLVEEATSDIPTQDYLLTRFGHDYQGIPFDITAMPDKEALEFGLMSEGKSGGTEMPIVGYLQKKIGEEPLNDLAREIAAEEGHPDEASLPGLIPVPPKATDPVGTLGADFSDEETSALQNIHDATSSPGADPPQAAAARRLLAGTGDATDARTVADDILNRPERDPGEAALLAHLEQMAGTDSPAPTSGADPEAWKSIADETDPFGYFDAASGSDIVEFIDSHAESPEGVAGLRSLRALADTPEFADDMGAGDFALRYDAYEPTTGEMNYDNPTRPLDTFDPAQHPRVTDVQPESVVVRDTNQGLAALSDDMDPDSGDLQEAYEIKPVEPDSRKYVFSADALDRGMGFGPTESPLTLNGAGNFAAPEGIWSPSNDDTGGDQLLPPGTYSQQEIVAAVQKHREGYGMGGPSPDAEPVIAPEDQHLADVIGADALAALEDGETQNTYDAVFDMYASEDPAAIASVENWLKNNPDHPESGTIEMAIDSAKEELSSQQAQDAELAARPGMIPPTIPAHADTINHEHLAFDGEATREHVIQMAKDGNGAAAIVAGSGDGFDQGMESRLAQGLPMTKDELPSVPWEDMRNGSTGDMQDMTPADLIDMASYMEGTGGINPPEYPLDYMMEHFTPNEIMASIENSQTDITFDFNHGEGRNPVENAYFAFDYWGGRDHFNPEGVYTEKGLPVPDWVTDPEGHLDDSRSEPAPEVSAGISPLINLDKSDPYGVPINVDRNYMEGEWADKLQAAVSQDHPDADPGDLWELAGNATGPATRAFLEDTADKDPLLFQGLMNNAENDNMMGLAAVMDDISKEKGLPGLFEVRSNNIDESAPDVEWVFTGASSDETATLVGNFIKNMPAEARRSFLSRLSDDARNALLDWLADN